MPAIRTIVVRDDMQTEDEEALTPLMVNLLIALLVLFFIALISVGALILLRHRRRQLQTGDAIPSDEGKASKTSNHRRLTITASPYGRNSKSIHVYGEKANLMTQSHSPPSSPDSVPEIRVTFPEEVDESGRSTSGRVVVVRVGERGIGMEPVPDEKLPKYEQHESTRFHSVDLERIGGLKEKDAPRSF
ncbi:MAG: hypothetical protein M1825_003076 [Sarcosagium campestre]|nr:MAG: hypothetical protein M1825_003076 [Sarcosagium campestre]